MHDLSFAIATSVVISTTYFSVHSLLYIQEQNIRTLPFLPISVFLKPLWHAERDKGRKSPQISPLCFFNKISPLLGGDIFISLQEERLS